MRNNLAGRATLADPSRARVALLVANGMGIVAAAVFAAEGFRRPNYVVPTEPVTPLAEFWAASSAVRTCALAGPLVVALARRASGACSGLLVAAGLVQLGDAALGVRQRNLAMTGAPAIMGVVHLVSARVLRQTPSLARAGR